MEMTVHDANTATYPNWYIRISCYCGCHDLWILVVQHTIPLSKQLEYYKECQKKLVGIAGKGNASSIISGSVYLISSGSSDFVQNYYINPLLYLKYTTDQFSDILIQSYATFVQVLQCQRLQPLQQSCVKQINYQITSKQRQKDIND